MFAPSSFSPSAPVDVPTALFLSLKIHYLNKNVSKGYYVLVPFPKPYFQDNLNTPFLLLYSQNWLIALTEQILGFTESF